MTIIFPTPTGDFWDTLRIATMSTPISEAQSQSRTAAGEIVDASLGSPLWKLSVTLHQSMVAQAPAVQVWLRILSQTGATFLAGPRIGRTPVNDPLGTVASSTVTIGDLPAGSVTLGLAGLPPGYAISVGDYISWVVAGKYHLHQFAEAGSADVTGNIAPLHVVPPILGDAAIGQLVTLVDPIAEFDLDGKTLNDGSFARAKLSGVTFSAIQTLR